MNEAAGIMCGGMGKIGAELSRFGGFGGIGKGLSGAGRSLGLSMPNTLEPLMGGLMNPGSLGLGAAAGAFESVRRMADHAIGIQRGMQAPVWVPRRIRSWAVRRKVRASRWEKPNMS